MARPHYIICCEGRIVDRSGGLVTHYNVLETLSLALQSQPHERVPDEEAPEAILAPLRLVMLAVWMREDEDDQDQQYEFEIRMSVPGADEPKLIHAGEFQFGEARFHRLEAFLNLAFVGREHPDQPAGRVLALRSGILRMESRIRPKGSEAWLSQEYLIPISVERVESETD